MKPKYIAPTSEEVEEIKQGNRETINRVYLANYPFILTICKAYCRNDEINNNLWEDMAQECYLYFDKFEFATTFAFIRCVRDTCVYVRWGGERVYHQVRQGNTEILTILDEPVLYLHRGHEPITLGETISLPFDGLDEIEPLPDFTDKVYEIVLKYLTPREKEAFRYFYYTDLTAREVGKEMGVKMNGAQSLKTTAKYRLRKHAEEIREELLNIGLDNECLFRPTKVV